jgi:hypothetical protein
MLPERNFKAERSSNENAPIPNSFMGANKLRMPPPTIKLAY